MARFVCSIKLNNGLSSYFNLGFYDLLIKHHEHKQLGKKRAYVACMS